MTERMKKNRLVDWLDSCLFFVACVLGIICVFAEYEIYSIGRWIVLICGIIGVTLHLYSSYCPHCKKFKVPVRLFSNKSKECKNCGAVFVYKDVIKKGNNHEKT